MGKDVRNNFLNLVVLQGRLTRDPEVKYTTQGTPWCSFDVAVEERYKQNDKWETKTHFITIKSWGPVAERVGEHLVKGSDVQIQGRLTVDEWKDRNTDERRTKVVVTASSVAPMSWPERADGASGGGGYSGGGQARNYTGPASGYHDTGRSDMNYDPIPEDDIPF